MLLERGGLWFWLSYGKNTNNMISLCRLPRDYFEQEIIFKLTEKPLQTLILVCDISFVRLLAHSEPSLLLFPSTLLKGIVLGIQAGPREYLTVLCPKIDVEHRIILVAIKIILLVFLDGDRWLWPVNLIILGRCLAVSIVCGSCIDN